MARKNRCRLCGRFARPAKDMPALFVDGEPVSLFVYCEKCGVYSIL